MTKILWWHRYDREWEGEEKKKKEEEEEEEDRRDEKRREEKRRREEEKRREGRREGDRDPMWLGDCEFVEATFRKEGNGQVS